MWIFCYRQWHWSTSLTVGGLAERDLHANFFLIADEVLIDCLFLLQVTKVMARMASADIMCVDSKAVKEKFTGMIRYWPVAVMLPFGSDLHRLFVWLCF